MPSPQVIRDLVARFHEHQVSYHAETYSEAQLRQEFLNPFFEALGWDIYNRQGYAEAYKDVIHEDSIKVGGATKAPDYCFRIGGARKFFVEAKKPAVNVSQDVAPAYQLRRYAWSAKLPLSILTDFEELAVYDCRVRPEKNDAASKARTLYLTFEQYEDRWDEIAAVFSREAVLKGAFDKYAESSKKKRGTAEVDAAFLAEIEEWRSQLARNLALRNPELSQREVNAAVQKTIDRIIFLRICEDRGIEFYGRLQALQNGPKTYARLCELFREADDRYNSGLFHFSAEKDRHEVPDEWTLSLNLDDAVLKDIVRNLYYPDSPYEFSVIGAEILGQVYEQFLGKVIRLTAGHHAVVEDKPEVKKAGGVYYTPTYVVDYIVQNTVGKLLEGKTPQQIRGTKKQPPLSILDPACGSGSFLIGAYQYLLDWYRDWFVNHDPGKHKKSVYQIEKGQWRLTTAERKRILLDHIYGVDIDPQAVEVTKLSLLLKVLEAENKESLELQRRFFHERALPDLCDNIKCGNSLIGPDFYDGRQMSLLDEDDRIDVNVFEWSVEFPAIIKRGGFHAVVGNPPYVRVQRLRHDEIDYFFSKYRTPASKTDLSQLFLEKSLTLASAAGLIGFITTSQWMTTDYGRRMRALVAQGHLHEITDFGSLPVFEKASTYPAILILSPQKTESVRIRRVLDKTSLNLDGIGRVKATSLSWTNLGDSPWNLGSLDVVKLVQRGGISWCPLGSVATAHYGIVTGLDDAFVLTADDAATAGIERDLLIPYAYRGEEVARFAETIPCSVILYPYVDDSGASHLLREARLRTDYPLAHEWLSSRKKALEQRKDSRGFFSVRGRWFGLVRPSSYEVIKPPKLIVKGIDRKLVVGLLAPGSAFSGANCPGIVLNPGQQCDIRYLLGLLNSKLLTFHARSVCPPKLNDYRRFNCNSLNALPIRTVSVSNAAEKRNHDEIVALVETTITLHKRLAETRTDHGRTALGRQIVASDAQIDRLVYELYGLTDEEIRIVEEATPR